MKLTDFTTLSFDCYGTLIDWEAGLLAALAGWRARTGLAASDQDLLDAFSRAEPEEEAANPDLLYPRILAGALGRMAKRFGVDATSDEARAFGRSVGDWPAFPDTAEALAALKQRYKLVILSNVDKASFARSNDKLGVEFDAIYTAQDIGSYKPDRGNFRYLLDHLKSELGVSPGELLAVHGGKPYAIDYYRFIARNFAPTIAGRAARKRLTEHNEGAE